MTRRAGRAAGWANSSNVIDAAHGALLARLSILATDAALAHAAHTTCNLSSALGISPGAHHRQRLPPICLPSPLDSYSRLAPRRLNGRARCDSALHVAVTAS
ncbi:hypothetical protein CALCODRAFT_262903 [Calocera cornea HHB12733]|uniref:Uncharacterized protein n=1 Tax=Calocera cornea HHB12733 TaxID=1353952 RepID=A0A165GG32_9BASI|nr:hypothetical protein CALCODRAFT_262903 [Calocera cornea HHB12733]